MCPFNTLIPYKLSDSIQIIDDPEISGQDSANNDKDKLAVYPTRIVQFRSIYLFLHTLKIDAFRQINRDDRLVVGVRLLIFSISVFSIAYKRLYKAKYI